MVNLYSAEQEKEPAPKTDGFEQSKIVEQRLMKNKEMYHLSGFPEISERDVQKYVETNEVITNLLPDLIRKGLKDEELKGYLGLQKPSSNVDVFTRVLQGPSIATWRQHGGHFQHEIDKQKERIVAAFEEMGIEHGHLHEGNFVLYFQRGKDGEPDITIPPRVYAIDFDMAQSR